MQITKYLTKEQGIIFRDIGRGAPDLLIALENTIYHK